jgi:hypothetical protein
MIWNVLRCELERNKTSNKWITFGLHLLQEESIRLLSTLMKEWVIFLHGRVTSDFIDEKWITEKAEAEVMSKSRIKGD